MPSRWANSSSDRARPVASSPNHARPRAIALISAGSPLDGWCCCADPSSTSLVPAPRRSKSTAVASSIVPPPGFSDARSGTPPPNSALRRRLIRILPQPGPKRPSKQNVVIAMLRQPEGATVDEVASVTGWQRHTVRGVFSGTLKKKLGLTLASAKEERGRVYRIAEPANL